MHAPPLGIHSWLSSPRSSVVRNRPRALELAGMPLSLWKRVAGDSERSCFRLMRCVFRRALRAGSSAGSQDGQETRHRGGGDCGSGHCRGHCVAQRAVMRCDWKVGSGLRDLRFHAADLGFVEGAGRSRGEAARCQPCFRLPAFRRGREGVTVSRVPWGGRASRSGGCGGRGRASGTAGGPAWLGQCQPPSSGILIRGPRRPFHRRKRVWN